MAVESAADRAIFVDTDEFGVTATFPALAGAPTIDGIFDNDAVAVLTNFAPGVQSTDPVFLCREADLPASLADGALLTVNGSNYAVRNREPDGTGMIRLQLEKVV